ncbi:pilin [Psychrobacter sp. S1-30-MNA-CIBAN-0213]|uniref:pilin n=1 Tax=Psychrobacter sp. S1-30-MNA-CIBAN-0213 TaxID=3140456 RepID=UPI00331FF377
MLSTVSHTHKHQLGFTLIEVIIVIAIVGILAAIATMSYQNYIRRAQLVTIYTEVSQFRMPYQVLIDKNTEATVFTPDSLNMLTQTKYCQFSVTSPNTNVATANAVVCHIQNLNYLSNQSLSLDRSADGSWQCTPSTGIPKAYLPQACQ